MSNISAEQSVIGSILCDNTILEKVRLILEPEDFSQHPYQQIFKAIVDMGTGIDLVTLDAQTGGKYTELLTMCCDVPTSANAVHYAKIVKESSSKRKVKKTFNDADIDLADSDVVIDTALKKLNAIREDTIEAGCHHVKTLSGNVATAMMTPGSESRGVKTHITTIDKALGCLRNGDLITIGARPSMGKTALTISIALNMAINGDPVLIISLEMSKEQLVERMLCQLSGVSMQDTILRLNVQDNAPRLARVAQTLHDIPVYLSDDVYRYDKIESVIKVACRESGVKAVFIDYLQLITTTKQMGDNRNHQLGYITRNLKRLAKELSIPITILAQLNRGLEQRPDKRPKLSDLRDSGEIEQDVDVAIFLYRDEVYHKDTDHKGTVELDIAKARNLSIAWLRLAFIAESMRFADLYKGER